MKEKFTKGPWRLAPMGPNNCPIVGNETTMVCMISDSVDEDRNAIHDAHLIAAAPDMYEALKVACDSLQYNTMCGNKCQHCEIYKTLKKARGES